MKWIKAATVGLLGSLVMFIVIQLVIRTDIAPFNLPPSAAFLAALDMASKPLAILLHFLYGTFWSVVFVALFKSTANMAKGLGLSVVLWLIMMIVYTPVIGWGVFGLQGTPDLPPDAPLYLKGGAKFIVSTLVVHLIYGAVIGWLNPAWIEDAETVETVSQ